jgi:hypothetical protein
MLALEHTMIAMQILYTPELGALIQMLGLTTIPYTIQTHPALTPLSILLAQISRSLIPSILIEDQ